MEKTIKVLEFNNSDTEQLPSEAMELVNFVRMLTLADEAGYTHLMLAPDRLELIPELIFTIQSNLEEQYSYIFKG